ERMHHDDGLAERVARGKAMMQAASTLRATSAAGTDLTVRLAGAFCAGSVGYTADPGDIAHWPGGLVLAFPAAGTVNGTLMLAPGDVNLTFKQYVQSPVRLVIADDRILSIEGDGVDAMLFSGYLDAF